MAAFTESVLQLKMLQHEENLQSWQMRVQLIAARMLSILKVSKEEEMLVYISFG